MARRRPKSERELLARRLVLDQGLAPGRATDLARRIANADDDIWTAALTWARTGRLPAQPRVHGQTPADLGDRFRPSQVFTGLMALRTDPTRALRAMRFHPGDLPSTAGAAFESEVAKHLSDAGWWFETTSESHGERRYLPDFRIDTPRGTLLVEAKTRTESPYLEAAVRRLAEHLEGERAAHAFLVVPQLDEGRIQTWTTEAERWPTVDVIPLDALRDRLADWR